MDTPQFVDATGDMPAAGPVRMKVVHAPYKSDWQGNAKVAMCTQAAIEK